MTYIQKHQLEINLINLNAYTHAHALSAEQLKTWIENIEAEYPEAEISYCQTCGSYFLPEGNPDRATQCFPCTLAEEKL